jgi:ComF family protein
VLLRPLLDALAPPLCAGCGANAGAAEPLCARCRSELRWLGPEPALVGLAPEPRARAGTAEAPEPPARTASPPVIAVWAPLVYEGPARGVVRALKFKGAHRAASAMAAQIATNAPPGWLESAARLVPVPLHPARARKRGYNQAALLATALAERTGLDVHDCLQRAGPKGTQVGRDRAQRLTGIAGSIRVETGRTPPAAAILVDDVITTGATLAACARALLENGTTDARAVGYARTPGR